jgi:hypothetical protein
MAKTDAPEDPAALIDEARQLRAQADEIEERAIRIAFKRAGWLEARAAQLLKMPRTSVQGLIGSRGRLRELGVALRRRRRDAGIGPGRPPKTDQGEA